MEPAVYRFGPYEADPRTRELRKHGLRVRLRRKSFEVLAALLEHAGEAVTRDELRRRLWPESVFVDFDGSLNSAVNRLRAVLRDSADKPRFVETLPQLGYRFVGVVETRRQAPRTLAVLPFDNLSADPAQDFLADGVTDALITALGNIGSLRVISRQSVLHLKGARRTLPEIARELRADALVEGSVLPAGERIRITAQLVEPDPEHHLWAASYECALGDILTLQGEVSRAIADAVRVVLTPAEEGRLARPHPVDAEAQQAYLRGRQHMGQWSRQSFEKALDCFRAAVAKDPGHARAYAHMADCYGMLAHWGHRPFLEAFRSSKQAAMQALALDDSLSTAHWAYGWATWIYDWDLATCRAEIVRAIRLNPSEAHAHASYSVFLISTTTERARAIDEMRRALELDPLSPYINALTAWVWLWARDYDRASEQASCTLEMYPNALLAWWALGLAETARSGHAAAVRALERAGEISPEPMSIAYLGAAHAAAGRRERAAALLAELESRRERETVPPRCFAIIHAALGEIERAIDWLERAYVDRDSGLFFLRAMSLYDPLRGDPRFRDLLRRVGLPLS